METNNIFTESYDDPIIDNSPDNDIDILSTDDVTTMDYDEIPDYAVLSSDEDNRTVTLARFCEKFKNIVISVIGTDNSRYRYFDFYNSDSAGVDIRNIDNLLDFVMWDGVYVTQSSDINPNKLMSFRTIEEHVAFRVLIWEERDSWASIGDTDVIKTDATITPVIDTSDDKPVNKIISVRDFKDYDYPQSYFNSIECAPDGGCDPEYECDTENPDCDPHESY